MLDQNVKSPRQATPTSGHKSQNNQTIILSNNPDNILGRTCWDTCSKYTRHCGNILLELIVTRGVETRMSLGINTSEDLSGPIQLR